MNRLLGGRAEVVDGRHQLTGLVVDRVSVVGQACLWPRHACGQSATDGFELALVIGCHESGQEENGEEEGRTYIIEMKGKARLGKPELWL